MNDSLWTRYPHLQRWRKLGPPARPNHEVSTVMARLSADCNERVLLLGVTPEIADLGAATLAVDHSAEMIAGIWPGNSAGRHAIQGDWLALPLPAGTFTAVIGDGSFNNMPYPDGYHSLCTELQRVLIPRGRIIMRAFITPEPGEGVAEVLAAARQGRWRRGPFHAIVWRVAMALAGEHGDPNVEMAELMHTIREAFPDQDLMSETLGYSREETEVVNIYMNSPVRLSYPTLAQLRTALRPGLGITRVVPSGSYALAERCPVIEMEVGAGPGD